jgi:hypothetical protein
LSIAERRHADTRLEPGARLLAVIRIRILHTLDVQVAADVGVNRIARYFRTAPCTVTSCFASSVTLPLPHLGMRRALEAELPERYEFNLRVCPYLSLKQRGEFRSTLVMPIPFIVGLEPRIRRIVVGERLLKLHIPSLQLSKEVRRDVKFRRLNVAHLFDIGIEDRWSAANGAQAKSLHFKGFHVLTGLARTMNPFELTPTEMHFVAPSYVIR